MEIMTQQIVNRDPNHKLLKAFWFFDDHGTDKNFILNLKCVAKERERAWEAIDE